MLYCYSHRLDIDAIHTKDNTPSSFAPHDISVILHLLGEEPTEVEAQGQSDLRLGFVNLSLSRLKFRSGVSSHIFASWLHPFQEQRLVVVGSEKVAVFDELAENKLVLYPNWTDRAGRRC